jgi:transmembrane sensor
MPDTEPELRLLTREAIAWLLRLTSGEATVEDAEAFERWHAQSPDHAAAWSEAVRLWRALGPALREWFEERELSEKRDTSAQLVRRRL